MEEFLHDVLPPPSESYFLRMRGYVRDQKFNKCRSMRGGRAWEFVLEGSR